MIFTETKILVHFYKKFQDTIIIFHDFPGLENGLTKFHDFPGRVVTLCIYVCMCFTTPAVHSHSSTNVHVGFNRPRLRKLPHIYKFLHQQPFLGDAGLGPGHTVLDGEPASLPKRGRAPNFRPSSLPPENRAQPPTQLLAMSVVTKWLDG